MVYVAIRLCLPTSIRILDYSFNTIAFTVMAIFILPELCNGLNKMSTISWNFKFCRNFAFFAIGLIVLSFIAAVWGIVPLSYQLSKLSQMLYTEVLPSVLLVIIMKKNKTKILTTLMAVCALYSLLYAIYTFVTQSNPIYEFFYIQQEVMLEAAANSRDGMLDGVAVGIYNNKISMSLMSLLYFIYFFNKIEINRILIGSVVALSFIVTILTSQRSAILAEFFFLGYMLFNLRHKIDNRVLVGGVFL